MMSHLIVKWSEKSFFVLKIKGNKKTFYYLFETYTMPNLIGL